MTEPMIKTDHLSHTYEDEDGKVVYALKDISLEIGKGEFVAIIGTNGSGKSTLAKHFNVLLTPTSGTCEVCGMRTDDPDNIWKIRQHVGMVFQNPDNQIVAAVVEEDVAFGPENLGIPSDEIKARVGFIAPITVYPGEDELLALAQGALRVLKGEEKALKY